MFDEVHDVVGERPVTATHAARLVTVQQVLKKSLRLFPTAPLVVRDINAEVECERVSVPAGTIGIIPFYAMH